jgi:hypothetical protein
MIMYRRIFKMSILKLSLAPRVSVSLTAQFGNGQTPYFLSSQGLRNLELLMTLLSQGIEEGWLKKKKLKK